MASRRPPDSAAPAPQGFRVIPDFPLYCANDSGDLMSFRPGEGWLGIKPTRRASGYFCVNIYKDGATFYRLVHRLILETFVGPCPRGQMGCHNNGDPGDNRLVNLRWDSMAGNMRDRIDHGTDARGSKNGRAKLTEDQVGRIKSELASGARPKDLGAKYGVKACVITGIKAGRRWAHVAPSPAPEAAKP